MARPLSDGTNRIPACLRRILIFGLLLATHSFGADQRPGEYQVKAAFLLNFTKFVEWPAGDASKPDAPISICILGEDPFGHTLDQIVEGETVNGRRVTVQRLKEEQPKACEVLFVSSSEKNVKKVLDDLPTGVLTVGEGEGFLRAGGAIAFVLENRRVRFDINQNAARNAKLKISSKLLNVARSVE